MWPATFLSDVMQTARSRSRLLDNACGRRDQDGCLVSSRAHFPEAPKGLISSRPRQSVAMIHEVSYALQRACHRIRILIVCFTFTCFGVQGVAFETIRPGEYYSLYYNDSSSNDVPASYESFYISDGSVYTANARLSLRNADIYENSSLIVNADVSVVESIFGGHITLNAGTLSANRLWLGYSPNAPFQSGSIVQTNGRYQVANLEVSGGAHAVLAGASTALAIRLGGLQREGMLGSAGTLTLEKTLEADGLFMFKSTVANVGWHDVRVGRLEIDGAQFLREGSNSGASPVIAADKLLVANTSFEIRSVDKITEAWAGSGADVVASGSLSRLFVTANEGSVASFKTLPGQVLEITSTNGTFVGERGVFEANGSVNSAGPVDVRGELRLNSGMLTAPSLSVSGLNSLQQEEGGFQVNSLVASDGASVVLTNGDGFRSADRVTDSVEVYSGATVLLENDLELHRNDRDVPSLIAVMGGAIRGDNGSFIAADSIYLTQESRATGIESLRAGQLFLDQSFLELSPSNIFGIEVDRSVSLNSDSVIDGGGGISTLTAQSIDVLSGSEIKNTAIAASAVTVRNYSQITVDRYLSAGYLEVASGAAVDAIGYPIIVNALTIRDQSLVQASSLTGLNYLSCSDSALQLLSDLNVANSLALSSGSIDVGGYAISANSISMSGSATIANFASVTASSLWLDDGVDFALIGSGSIGYVTLSDGATFTTSGGSVTIGSITNRGGRFVTGGNLNIASGLSFDSGVFDAGGHSISASSISMSGSSTITNFASLTTSVLSLDGEANVALTGSGSIGYVMVSGSATLTTSGGGVAIGAISSYGGSVVLGGDLDVTGGLSVDSGAFNAGGNAIAADSVHASGSSSFANLASLTTSLLSLDRGVSFATPGSGSIGTAYVSDGATLMISGGSTTIGALSINGGNAVLGEDLDVEHYVALEAGTIDAGGNRISANSITLGSWEGTWSVTNLGRVVTPNLLIMNGSVTLNGGVVDSITTIAASIDLWMDATSAFTADSAILLSGLSISPGGTLRLNSFGEYEGMDRVGLRWSGGDHSAVLSGYLQDGRIGYRAGLGNLRAVYDVDSDSTLIIDPYAVNAFDVETNVEMYASGTASIVGNTTVRKTGNGTLLLTGSNSYYAGTTIDAGKVVAGSVHAFGMGEVVVNGGTLDLASMPVANPTTIVSGSIANAENYEGYLNLAGTVSLTGTVGGLVSVNANGELKGSNTTFTGPVLIESEGQHSPGSSPGTQTFEDGLSYAAGSMLNWELIANSVGGAGTSYDFLSLTGGSLLVEDGAIMNLAFSGNGSTVNWSNGFWDAEHSWIVIDALAAIDSTGNFTLGVIGDDALGQSLMSVRPTAGFAIENSTYNIVLSYSPVAVPEPSTYAMALVGLGCISYVAMRRRNHG
jgi:autotransporter-associated beta strand protein